MKAVRIYQRLQSYQPTVSVVVAPLLLLVMAGVYGLVYSTGGIKYVFSHSMYLPILIAGLIYGVSGGVVIAVIGGIVLGPFMPIEVTTGEPQKTVNWLYRACFFALVGGLSGMASDAVRSHVRQLRWLTRHDSATGLPNRTALVETLKSRKAGNVQAGNQVLGIISIQNSAELRSVFGFEVIEDNMQQLAARALQHLPNEAQVFRTEAEQVGFLAECDAAKMAGFFSSIGSSLRLPFLYNDIPIHLDIRIGFIAIDKPVEDAEGYLRKAQAASLLVSENGDDVSQYHAGIHWHARESLAILGELTEGIDRGEISLHYQPKICLRTGAIIGAEALMRWHHRERGMISPGDFIPRAEQSTLIHTITAFALDQALQQAAEWHGLGIRIPIAINVSPRNLLQPGFCEAVLAAMKRTGATTDMLELEVTENVLMTDIERVAVELQQLAGHGIKIAIDDFGAGYSSLTYLYRLPVTHLKVDKSFVQGLAEEEVSAHIVEAVVSMARKIGIKTIAEGVETEVVYERLRDLGCDVAQGFFIAKPMPAAEFERWYRNWRGRPQLTT